MLFRSPNLFWGGSEGGEGVGVARAGEFPDYAIEVAMLVADGGHLGCMGVDLGIPGRHVVGAEWWVGGIFVSAIGSVYLL